MAFHGGVLCQTQAAPDVKFWLEISRGVVWKGIICPLSSDFTDYNNTFSNHLSTVRKKTELSSAFGWALPKTGQWEWRNVFSSALFRKKKQNKAVVVKVLGIDQFDFFNFFVLKEAWWTVNECSVFLEKHWWL